MNNQNATFSLKLSPAELHWLAGAFGVISLPLLEDPLRSFTASQQKPMLVQALGSLQERGLIRGSARAGWQVDRLPAAVIQWLGSAANMLVLDVHTNSGIARRAQVFSEEGASMHVSVEEGQFHFLFLPDRKAVSDYLLDRLGASFLDPKPAADTYAFSQPATILRAAWKDHVLAAEMLKVTRLKPKAIKSLLTWAESLEWVVALTRVPIEAKKTGEQSQAFLCGNRNGCWAGRVDGSPDEPVTLSSMNIEETRALIENTLQG